MKVIDCSPSQELAQGAKPLSSVMHSLKYGQEWVKDMQAQASVVSLFTPILDNQYLMLRNVKLEGLDIPIPLVLIGPTGLRVLYPSSARGVFRAKGEIWEKLDESQQVYKTVKPNLLGRVALMAKAVNAFLSSRDHNLPVLEPVLIFPNPGTHVEQVRPVVRVVLVDGIERYASGLTQSRAFLSQEEMQNITNLFSSATQAVERAAGRQVAPDSFSFVDERAKLLNKEPPAVVGMTDAAMKRLSSKLPFSGKQMGILIVLIVVNVLILLGVALYILYNQLALI